MKLFAFGSVVALAISNVLALSISCMLESAKYGSCVPELKKVPVITDAKSMEEFCNNLKNDGCKSFVADAGLSTTKCDISDENDKELATLIYTARIGYLSYCVTDKDGNTCPLSQYLLSQTSNLQGEAGLVAPTQEDLNIFLEDCKKEECNKRLTDLIEVVKAYSKARGNEEKELPKEFDDIVAKYKEKKCEELIGVNATVSNNATNADAAKQEDNESGASTIKTISSTLSVIILIAILFM